jgi:hypothetical protein
VKTTGWGDATPSTARHFNALYASHVVLEQAEEPNLAMPDCAYMPKLMPVRLAVDDICVDSVGTFDVFGGPNAGMSYEWKLVLSPFNRATVIAVSEAISQPLEGRQVIDDADSQPCISAAVCPTRSLSDVDTKPKFIPAMVRYRPPETGTFAQPRCGPVDEITGASYEATPVIVALTSQTVTAISIAAPIAGAGAACSDVSETQLVDEHAEPPIRDTNVSIYVPKLEPNNSV